MNDSYKINHFLTCQFITEMVAELYQTMTYTGKVYFEKVKVSSIL